VVFAGGGFDGIFWVELDRFSVVGDSTIEIALPAAGDAAAVIGAGAILRGFTSPLENACAAHNGAIWIIRFTIIPIALTGARGG
jgi:hypothetical protein